MVARAPRSFAASGLLLHTAVYGETPATFTKRKQVEFLADDWASALWHDIRTAAQQIR